MTYGFTSDFKAFIDQLSESDEFSKLTIEKYQELTSDNSNGTASGSETTTLTLNQLASKYATYLNRKSGKENLDSFIEITKQADGTYTKEEIVVGSYLVLPTEVVSRIEEQEGLTGLYTYMYGVSVANINFSILNSEWELTKKHQVTSKSISGNMVNYLLNINISNFLEELENASTNNDIVYSSQKDLELMIMNDPLNHLNIPENTNTSILNNETIMEKITQIEYIFPEGITLDKIYMIVDGSIDETIVRDESIYYIENNKEYKLTDFTKYSENNSIVFKNILFANGDRPAIIFSLKVNDGIKLGTTTNGNTITTNAYYLKDAYVDISGMTQEEAEAKVLGVGTLTNTVYTYGVKVTNKDNSTLLNGAKFQVCLDKDCNTKVGEEFAITENGTCTFKGLNDTDTYYLKQTKASTGYKMASTITLSPTSLNKETGYYDVEVTSAKMGLLPTTGGLGTILYTTFGLLIIVVGSVFFIKYRKKQVNN